VKGVEGKNGCTPRKFMFEIDGPSSRTSQEWVVVVIITKIKHRTLAQQNVKLRLQVSSGHAAALQPAIVSGKGLGLQTSAPVPAGTFVLAERSLKTLPAGVPVTSSMFGANVHSGVSCLEGICVVCRGAIASSVEEPATGGRPKLQLPLDIEQYLNDGYTEIEIARLCGVSRYTVRCRMRERGIQRFSAIGDNPLSTTVQHIADEGNGQWGVGMTDGKLRSLRIRVPRSKLRSLLKILDPQAHAARSFLARHRITRVRPYSIRGPGALWHFDANLKLRRYKFAIHGCVDGFSRKIMYMHVTDNMRAQTVFDLFHDACMRHNYIPSRARCNQGRENVVVADFMLRQRGLHRGSILVGASVHNQRIERMWLDVRTRFISKVVDVFGRFEDDGMLNVEDDVCMHTVHLVVGPHLRSMLADFVTAWNCHRMRTPTGISQ
jgi:hypothetical protein